MGPATAVATFACGCFWSKEYFFSRVPGVQSTRVGYTGGHHPHPTYQQVCTKKTGHAEAVEVTFDPDKVRYETLVRFFFELHDPTADRRDKGGQYRSAIFCHTQAQQRIATDLKAKLQERGYAVKTEIESASVFWEAEDRHQQYCENRGIQPKSFLENRWAEQTTDR
jgi:methionine-S-sulfoxide reductase